MQPIFFTAALWLGLAVLAAIIAHYLDISIALVEICIGIAAGAIADGFFGQGSLGNSEQWLQFLASAGAILLTFLAGAELDPGIMKRKMKEVSLVGIVGFAAPFIGATAAAYLILNWSFSSSLLAGIALSTTSMAVVYAVMVETGLNRTEFGKGILGACFINDLGTVLALGLVFSPFTYRTLVFVGVSVVILIFIPSITRFLTRVYGNRTAAIRTKWVIAVLLGLGALAYWSGSEAVLPAYVVGIVLAEFASVEEQWIRRLRTLTTGFLTPFYFIRAGSFVSVPALIAAPAVFIVLIVSKVGFKIFGLYPVISRFRKVRSERWYYTLMMSTGLTFGTISAMFGLSHGILTEGQYSALVATVIVSALVPTFIATKWFLPAKLVAAKRVPAEALRVSEGGLADE
jgi:Kef-type K+ transport system membrane component KefB